jgi:hypothetical protein
MQDYFPKGWNYAKFIEAIRELIPLAQKLHESPSNIYDPEFKEWRHTLLDAVERIEALGYSINTRVLGRNFAPTESVEEDPDYEFTQAMEETLIELKLVVKNYEKYGDPNVSSRLYAIETVPVQDLAPISDANANPHAVSKTVEPLLFEKEKMTLRWVLDNVPVQFWLWLGSAGVALFIAGFSVGGWQPITEGIRSWSAAQKVQPQAVAPTPPRSIVVK